MYICIICDTEKVDETASSEHVFPYAIGGNLTIGTVCKTCNTHLADYCDIHLIDHWFIQNKRLQFNIAGRSGEVPNPFENATMADDPSQQVKYFIKDGKPQSVYNLTNVERVTNADGSEQVLIRVDKKDEAKIPIILEKIKTRYQQQDKEVKFTPPNRDDVRIELPQLKVEASIDIYDFQKGLVKIAYEVACLVLGPKYRVDPCAKRFRDALLDKSENPDWILKHTPRGYIGPYDNKLNFPFNPNFHYALVLPVDAKQMGVYIKVFDVFEAFLPVSETPEVYTANQDQLIELDPVKRTHRFVSLFSFVHQHLNP